MTGYVLSPRALREVSRIISDLHGSVGATAETSTETMLFNAFEDLARYPGLGHRRYDLTTKNVLFHAARPYVIMMRRKKEQTHILRVVHGSRDITKLL